MKKKIDLVPFTTFGVPASANELIRADSIEFLKNLYRNGFPEPFLILGGGSNILFTSDYLGTVIKLEIKGRKVIEENDNQCIIEFGGGENWHECVEYSLNKGYSGIENLSLIPGNIGSAPIQNIGAYGVELKDVFYSLDAFNLENGEMQTFNKEECEFGYRDSIFKRWAKGKFIITHVCLILNKKHEVHTEYGAIKNVLHKKGIETPTPLDISEAVIEIRKSKLPDPAEIGNGGSFFKNPVINESQFELLKEKYPDLPSYPAPGGIKIPAGWLIDQDGWKGHTRGNVGVHKNQALVLVNYGGGSGAAIRQLALDIQASVFKKFGVMLEPEVNIIGG